MKFFWIMGLIILIEGSQIIWGQAYRCRNDDDCAAFVNRGEIICENGFFARCIKLDNQAEATCKCAKNTGSPTTTTTTTTTSSSTTTTTTRSSTTTTSTTTTSSTTTTTTRSSTTTTSTTTTSSTTTTTTRSSTIPTRGCIGKQCRQ